MMHAGMPIPALISSMPMPGSRETSKVPISEMHAGMPIPALISSMPMPGSGETSKVPISENLGSHQQS
jgi:hypothetical protein